MGVLRIPDTSYEKAQKIINEIAEDVVYQPEFQDVIAPAGYFKSLKYYSKYLQHCSLLPYINNEKVFNPQYKNRMTQLKFLAAIKYLKDTVVVPKESEHFGYFADASEKSFKIRTSF